MTKREFNSILNKHKELRKQINDLVDVDITRPMKVLVCKGKCTVSTFNLRELNKHIFK